MQNIIIDEEFKSLLPALDKDTHSALEENLIANGCRDSLILWNDILIDGYNRYELCTKNNIPFNTVSKEFESREEVLIWIISNQVSRRNLTQIQLSFFRGLHYKADRKIVTNARGKNQYGGQKVVEPQNEVQPKKGSTSARLAEKYKVSQATIERDAKVSVAIEAIGEISPEAKRKILSGEAPVNKKDLRELPSKSKEELETLAIEIVDGTYGKKTDVPTGHDKIDALADSISTQLRRLDALISSTMKAFNTRLHKFSECGGKAEYKTALRAYINSLEEMYESI